MKYIYTKHHSKLATIMVGFSAGSRVEYNSKYPKGIAHLMEHMRFKGTAERDHKQLAKHLALYGGSSNAFTSNDMVCYYLSIPEDNFRQGCEYLSDLVLRPIFPKAELKKEREVVCQEVRMYNDDIGSLVRYHIDGKVFQDNPIQSPIAGTEESVRATTQKHLLDFNAEFYTPDQMAVVVASTTNHKDEIVEFFGNPDGKLTLLSRPESVSYASGFSDEVVKKGQIQNTIEVCFGSEDIRKLGDTEAAVYMFDSIFGGSDISRLHQKVREDLGLVYDIGSFYYGRQTGALYAISTLTEPTNKDKVLKAVDKEIKRFIKDPPTQEEMTMARNKLKTQIYRGAESSTYKCRNALDETFFGYKKTAEILKELDKVTVEDVLNVAKTVFSGNKYTVIGHGGNNE